MERHPVDLARQSVPVDPQDNSSPRRSAQVPNILLSQAPDDNILTLCDNFANASRVYADRPFLGTRALAHDGTAGPYQWLTYKEAYIRAHNVGSAMVQLGYTEKARVGLYSINRVEWALAEQACNMFSHVTISLYDTLGPTAAEYIIGHAEISLVFCSKDKLINIAAVSELCPSLKTVVSLDVDVDDTLKTQITQRGLAFYTLAELEMMGSENPVDVRPPRPGDVATILYTSGTTGDPKGVLLSHGNFIADIAGLMAHGVDINRDDTHISFLPLAHVFERIVQAILIKVGGAIGFYRGDVSKLIEDVAELKPTVFVGVPRVFNRLYDRIKQTIGQSGWIRKWVFESAFAAKRNKMKNGEATPWLDALVFNKIKQRLGGRVRLMITGSAPIGPKIQEFLQTCFSVQVLQGYGLTETTAAATIQVYGDYQAGRVGAPIPCNEVKLVDVPEMDYMTTNDPPQGEVCIRGPNVFLGYYKMEKETKAVLDDDGWFHSGDIACWNRDGTLSIIDRKKNIFKLAQGEYVAAEYLEGIYAKCPFVSQIFIYGNSYETSLVGIIVPDEASITQWAKSHQVTGDPPKLCENPRINQAVLESLNECGKAAKLKGFEFLKRIFLDLTPFTIDNDMLTPTFKLRRHQALKKYKAKISAMYDDIHREDQISARG